MNTKLRQIKIESLEKIKIPKKSEREVIILKKDENSYIMKACRESTQEFFERIYDEDGPFWGLYERAGFAAMPRGVKYALYVGNNLYLSKNIEDKYMYKTGTEKHYEIRNNVLIENTKWSARNFLFILSWPFDIARQFASMIQFSFLVNEMIPAYERSCRSALEFYNFYSDEDNIYDAAKTAEEAMDRAIAMMEYSVAAFICHKYKIRPRYSKYIAKCELEKFSMYIETRNIEAIMDEFGFYSDNPYDISCPRIFEQNFEIEKYSGFAVPKDYSLRWRENVKFIIARYMQIVRICYKLMGQKTNLGDDIFFLKTRELHDEKLESNETVERLAGIANARKELYENRKNLDMPEVLIFKNEKYYEIRDTSAKKGSKLDIKAVSVSSQTSIDGDAVNIDSFADYGKCKEGSIILSKTLSPNLVVLFKKTAGIICETGGFFSHAAIIAREMNLPCLVQAKIGGAIEDGQKVRIDGKKGTITILEDEKKLEKKTTHNDIKKPVFIEDVTTPELILETKQKIVLNKNPKNDFYVLSTGKLSSKNAGNKAANLSEIYKQFNVPDGFVIDSEYFKKLIDFERINAIIRKIGKADISNSSKLEEYYNMLLGEIVGVEFSRKLRDEIGSRYSSLSSKLVAARSSSSCEDSAKASFAGQFDSYINIGDMDSLELGIKHCWASFYSPRSVVYRREKKIRDENARMAILVQKMINAKYSGIAFSRDIMNNDAISIEIIPGTCEKLASGEVSPNIYVIDRESLSILKVNANYDFDDNQVISIANEALKLEKFFNEPQDVEWCIDESNKIWIIQTRPITSTCNIK